MRALRHLVGFAVLALAASLAAVPTTASGETPSAAVAARHSRTWAPPQGVILSNPQSRNRRVILSRVIEAIQHTPRGQTIRIAVWNFDDYPTRRALIAADQRGVNVKVVVAGSVRNGNWTALARQLNRRTNDQSYARKCRGGCRSASKIMHSKIFLFSRIGTRRNISMYGSANLTTPAGNRQWNDMVTSYGGDLYRAFSRTFEQYARDRAIRPAYSRRAFGPYVMWLWPSNGRNTIADELSKVRCKGAAGMPGGRTKIRIAIAGWFDAFGDTIARRIRRLWDAGCNVRIVTTLAGRGVNRVLKQRYGRGPVPIRRVGIDNNRDGVPEKYLHMKALVVKGSYGRSRRARVLWTGSPNWSSRAANSDEVLVRYSMGGTGIVDKYIRHVDSLYSGPFRPTARTTTTRTTVGAPGDPLLKGFTEPGTTTLPKWFELD